MTKNILLDRLRDFTLDATRDIIMPVKRQKEDKEDPEPRAADVYRMRLPDSKSATKKAPYVLHQIITGKDIQPDGRLESASVTVRTIFCVYSDDEQEGGLMLLNLMERFRIKLLREVIIGDQFQLDLESGLESLIYPDDTAPFFAGEMVSVWKMPSVEREVRKWL